MKTGWIFRHNWAMRVSKCFVYCKNPQNTNQKYTIEFHFIGGQTYTVEFANKKARDNHFKFIIRMLEQSDASPYASYAHWALHVFCLVVIVCLLAIIY